MASFREAVRDDPDDARLAVEVASYLGMRFEVEEAVEILSRCEQQLIDNSDGLYEVGLPLSSTAFEAPDRFLEITVDGELLMPRRLFNATTFVLNGRIAENPSVTRQLRDVIDGVCEVVQ